MTKNNMIFRTTNNSSKKQPWQCPGCEVYYAPHVDSCDCDEKWEDVWSSDPFPNFSDDCGDNFCSATTYYSDPPKNIEVDCNCMHCASDSN